MKRGRRLMTKKEIKEIPLPKAGNHDMVPKPQTLSLPCLISPADCSPANPIFLTTFTGWSDT